MPPPFASCTIGLDRGDRAPAREHVTHKAAVDLDARDRQALEIDERVGTGAEVIERQPLLQSVRSRSPALPRVATAVCSVIWIMTLLGAMPERDSCPARQPPKSGSPIDCPQMLIDMQMPRSRSVARWGPNIRMVCCTTQRSIEGSSW